MIESLKNVDVIAKHQICVMDDLRKNHPEMFNHSGSMDYKLFEANIRPNYNIYLRHDKDSLTFNMMTKPASEGGKGCQFTDLIETALIMLKHLNSLYSCRENAITITKLEEALMWQEARTKDRLKRGVEGINKQ